MKKYKTKRARKEALAAYTFILPFITGILIFNVYAFLKNIFISFTNKKSFGAAKFIGMDNYVRLFGDEKFYQALINTLCYIVICVPAIIILSLLIALALNVKLKGIGIFRTLIYLPIITLPTAVGMVWKWLFNNQFGLINAVMGKFGIQGPAWLSDPNVSLIAVCIVLIWCSIGTAVIIFLAGLQGIPRDQYEAASVDGATRVQQFLYITLPGLKGTIKYVVMITMIQAMKLFTQPYVMTQGGPKNSTKTLVYYIYTQGFQQGNFGYACSVAAVFFVIVVIMSLSMKKLIADTN